MLENMKKFSERLCRYSLVVYIVAGWLAQVCGSSGAAGALSLLLAQPAPTQAGLPLVGIPACHWSRQYWGLSMVERHKKAQSFSIGALFKETLSFIGQFHQALAKSSIWRVQMLAWPSHSQSTHGLHNIFTLLHVLRGGSVQAEYKHWRGLPSLPHSDCMYQLYMRKGGGGSIFVC